jgi:hypothetical protein
MTDPVVIAAVRARWCRDSAGHRPQASPDRRPYASTPSPAGNSADYSPSAGAEQTTPERALAGIIGVRRSRHRIDQSRSDHTGDGRLPFHSLHLYVPWGGDLTDADRPVEKVSLVSRDARLTNA